MNRVISTLIVCLILGLNGLAQETTVSAPGTATDAPTKEDVHKLLVAQRSGQIAPETISNYFVLTPEEINEVCLRMNCPPESKKRLVRAFEQALSAAQDDAEAPVIDFYRATFTKTEIDGLLSFEATPAAQKRRQMSSGLLDAFGESRLILQKHGIDFLVECEKAFDEEIESAPEGMDIRLAKEFLKAIADERKMKEANLRRDESYSAARKKERGQAAVSDQTKPQQAVQTAPASTPGAQTVPVNGPVQKDEKPTDTSSSAGTKLTRRIKTDTPASKKDVLRYLEAMHSRQFIRELMDAMAKPIKETAQAQCNKEKEKLPPDCEARLGKLMGDMLNLPFEQLLDASVPVYQKYLSKEDLDALTNFYGSQRGQQILDALPTITAESMNAVRSTITEHNARVVEEFEHQIELMKSSEGTSITKSHP